MSARFAGWLSAATLAALGDGVLYFALGWSAAGLGGGTAGLVISCVVLPRTALLLFGGAAADRWGLRRTMLCCDIALGIALIGFLALQPMAPEVVVLFGLAFIVGTTSAFRMPAAGAFPRLFADEASLSRVLATTSGLLQTARLAGPPVGGVIVAAFGVTGAIGTQLVGAFLIAVTLLAIRPPYEARDEPTAAEPTLRRIADGVRAAATAPGVPALLGAVALLAAGTLPMLSVCVPLAAYERGWSARTTGLVEACWIVGTLAVTLVVARFGTYARAIVPLVFGPVLGACGAAMIALSQAPTAAFIGSVVLGVGTALLTTHALPLLIVRTPDGMLARFQSLLGLVQAAPILLSSNILGALGADGHATRAILAVAASTLASGVIVALSPPLRSR